MNETEVFGKMIKKEKRKKILLTVGISIGTTLVIALVGFFMINQRMGAQFKKAQEAATITDLIESPNIISTSQYTSEYGRLSSQIKSDRFKNIDGYMVKTNPLEIDYNLFGVGYGGVQNSPLTVPINKTKQIGAFSRQNGEKVPVFFNPKHELNQDEQAVGLSHESKTLSSLEKHVAEVAISFKNPMSYAEIKKVLPDNLLINWYWIGMDNDKLAVTDTVGKVIGINTDREGELTDNPVKENDSSEWVDNNYPAFVAAVKKAASQRSYTVNDIDIYQDALKQVKKYPTLDKAKFSGVIVSGRTENLAKLDDEPYIYATSVGVEAEMLPYIEPIK